MQPDNEMHFYINKLGTLDKLVIKMNIQVHKKNLYV